MTEVGTIVEALERRAGDGDDPALWFESLDGDGGELSAAGLLATARASAAALAGRGVRPGDAVVIVLPTGRDFVASFYGTLAAGAIGVPIYPPASPHQLQGFLESIERVTRLVKARAVVTLGGLERIVRDHLAGCCDVWLVDEVLAGAEDPGDAVARPRPTDLALIQFSSGSTSEPKGVALSHGNIVENICAFQDAIDIHPPDVGTNWLPLYHDMGLIGTLMGSMVCRIPLALFSPLDFLRRPAFWFEVLSRRGTTIGVAPQFAYNLCLAKVTDEDLEGIDLSHVRVLLNGAEPVDVEVVHRFEERFAVAGLRRGVVTPCYGLAEHALAVTMSPPGREIPTRRLDRTTSAILSDGDAAVAEHVMTVASAGPPVRGATVEIVGDDGEPLPDETVGEISVTSASVCNGYVGEDGISEIRDERGRLRTGDLGFRSQGEIFPVDRRKDVIIVAGRNVYPQDVEREVGKVEGTLRGRVAVFGIHDPSVGTEGVVVAAEVSLTAGRDLLTCAAQARQRVVRGLGVTPYDVLLLPKGRLPLTSSGKVRRHRIRDEYERGLPQEDALYSLRAAAERSRQNGGAPGRAGESEVVA